VRAQELVVGLAPTAVAAAAMEPGGEAPPPKQGHLTGRPARFKANDKDPDNMRVIERENESARRLADNGYDVEQNPPPRSNGKERADGAHRVLIVTSSTAWPSRTRHTTLVESSLAASTKRRSGPERCARLG
jgi:hypothetical protein